MKKFYRKLLNILSTSKAMCYVYYDERHTYDECYSRMRLLNSILYGRRQERIGLYVSKSFDAYCAIYSILLSENIWVPLTPDQPESRTLQMIKSAEPTIIFTDSSLPLSIERFARKKGISTYLLADIIATAGTGRGFNPGKFPASDLAYIMFTSGSTGAPKGVPMTHGNYTNFIENVMKVLPFSEHEVFSDYHDYAFDISVFYIFCAVLTESALAPTIRRNEKLLPLDNIISNKVTVWSSVPSVISRIKELRPDDAIKTSIKIMFLCGEPFRLELLKYCYENLGLSNVYNFYGLTETGVENFFHRCSVADLDLFKEKGFVPIGKPLAGNEPRITFEKELLLSGCQITPGYLGGTGSNKFEIIDGKRWYHTGDIVERFKDDYFCKGRLDSQVKISGYRIELMDIEANVRLYKKVADAVCFVDEGKLVCTIKTSGHIALAGLELFLSKRLPQYMIPREFVLVRSFPVNANGKIDRRKIAEMYKHGLQVLRDGGPA